MMLSTLLQHIQLVPSNKKIGVGARNASFPSQMSGFCGSVNHDQEALIVNARHIIMIIIIIYGI